MLLRTSFRASSASRPPSWLDWSWLDASSALSSTSAIGEFRRGRRTDAVMTLRRSSSIGRRSACSWRGDTFGGGGCSRRTCAHTRAAFLEQILLDRCNLQRQMHTRISSTASDAHRNFINEAATILVSLCAGAMMTSLQSRAQTDSLGSQTRAGKHCVRDNL